MKLIITGIAGGGKTSLINALKQEGFKCHPEVSRTIIQQQLNQNGSSVPWINMQGFTDSAFQKMIIDHNAPNLGIEFYDRGIPDLIGYLNHQNISPPKKYFEALKSINYHQEAYLIHPWEDIYINDNERPESFQLATERFYFVKKAYHELGFKLVDVPNTSVENRTDFVMESLKKCI